MTSDDEGEGGGGTIPPKNDDVIYEQPLTHYPMANMLSNHYCIGPKTSGNYIIGIQSVVFRVQVHDLQDILGVDREKMEVLLPLC